jgi:hypothetical protein
MIKTKGEFEEANILCQSIIENFDETSDMQSWLQNYRNLYDQINIEPKGLPGIANSHHDGIKYEHISKFHNLYSMIKLKYLDIP